MCCCARKDLFNRSTSRSYSMCTSSDRASVASPDWSNESNNSVAALLMPESNDKAPEGAANGSAQPLAQPDTANGPDGGSEAPVADPAQARIRHNTLSLYCKRRRTWQSQELGLSARRAVLCAVQHAYWPRQRLLSRLQDVTVGLCWHAADRFIYMRSAGAAQTSMPLSDAPT